MRTWAGVEKSCKPHGREVSTCTFCFEVHTFLMIFMSILLSLYEYSRKDFLAKTLSDEQAKVLPLAQVEVNASIEYLNYYAGFARIYEGEIIQSDDPQEQIYLHRIPLGVRYVYTRSWAGISNH